MTLRSLQWLWPRAVVAMALGLCPVLARAQNAWIVDARTSIAWWQIAPHFGSLWATTCPEEPSWHAGDGASSQWQSAATNPKFAKGSTNNLDTVDIPLYPRDTVSLFVRCRVAVQGQILLPDTVTWRGISGAVDVALDSLETGSSLRDRYAAASLLQTEVYPDVRYTIDSVVDLTKHGDTLVGTARGVLSLRGVDMPLPAAIRAWREREGMRVLARLHFPARALEDQLKMSKTALSLGVGTNVWKELFMGVDLVLKPEPPAHN